MKVAVLDHHGKSEAICAALRRGGIEVADRVWPFDYDLVMTDSDHPRAPPAPDKYNVLCECAHRGIPIVIYPHGAPPDLDYDGLRSPTLQISMRLVTGEGHAEVARRYGCKHRVEVVGWTFGEEAEPVAPPVSPSSLLFAPIHPWANGTGILPMHRNANLAAYYQFLQHPAERKTVRMYGADEPNGIIHREPGVEYTQSDLGPAGEAIDSHALILSYGTLAYTALQRGKPTVFIYPYPGHTDDLGNVEARRFEEYKEYVRYPACVGEAPLDELFARDVTEWKRLFIGGPLDEDRLVSLLSEFRANRAQRRKLAKMR